MTTPHIVLLAVLCGSACVTAEGALAELPEDRTLSEDAALVTGEGEIAIGDDPSLCDLLPAEGICSLLCDPDRLAEALTPGTCAALVCTLTDGRSVQAHACNP